MKRLLDCTASDFRTMNKEELLASIAGSEGRVLACESIGYIQPMLGNVTNAEFTAAMGADILLLNMFDVQKPVIQGLPKCEPRSVVSKLKALTGRPIGINLEPVDQPLEQEEGDLWAMTDGRKATLENARRAADMGVNFILLTGNPGVGVTNEAIVRTLKEYKAELGDRLVLDDCYNANPQSVTAALEVLAKTECGRKVAVLGDMGELGELTDQAHYNMGALAAMLGIDEVVAIGTKAEKIADGAAQSGGSVTHFATKEEAVRTLTDLLTEDTAMLVKASHAMHFGWIVEQLKQDYD